MKVRKIQVYPSDGLYFIAYQIFTNYLRIIISPDGLSWFEDPKTKNYIFQIHLGKDSFFGGKQKTIYTYKDLDEVIEKEKLSLLTQVISDLLENRVESVEDFIFYSDYWKRFEQENNQLAEDIVSKLIKKYNLKTLKEK